MILKEKQYLVYLKKDYLFQKFNYFVEIFSKPLKIKPQKNIVVLSAKNL